MKILVAGGAGYIGSILVPRLINRGYQVDVVDLLWFGNHLPEEINLIQRNVFDLTEDDLRDYEQVIFLAGLSNDPMAEYSPGENFTLNAAAPAFLGYIAKRAGVKRYVYASSCSVYGYTSNEFYSEESPTVSNYAYGISKLQGERAAMQLVDDGFSVICLRQGTVCGYSPRMRLDLVINTMFRHALTDLTITVNNPAIWRPILSIQDAATAYIRSVEANLSISGVFNVASGNYTLGELGDLVKSIVEETLGLTLTLNIRHFHDLRNYKVSIEKARSILSFKPGQDGASIVRELLGHREAFSDFDNPNYHNIQMFKLMKRS